MSSRDPGAGLHGATWFLLDRGAPVEARDERGRSPLHWAAFGSPVTERGARGAVSRDIAQALLEHGAEPAPKGEDGRTPLDLLDLHRPARDKPALAELLRRGLR